MATDHLHISESPTKGKPPRAFNHPLDDAARMQGGQWHVLAAWCDMRPAQRAVYAALDRLRVLRNVPASVCEGCGCRKHCALTKEIRKAERAVEAAKQQPECRAYDEMIQARRYLRQVGGSQ
jgi:hypothetical protein